MRTFQQPTTAVTFAALLLAFTGPGSAATIAKGRALAEQLCATCHMGPDQGEKQSASEIPGFQAVAERPDQSVEGIIQWLRSVPPMMPDHRLSQDEMEAIAQFIMSLRTAQP